MNPEAHDYWDGNWLTTPIYLEVGWFTGTLPASLRVEDWLTLRVACRRTGALEVTGVACDQPGIGNRLEFAVAGLDQTYLPA